MTITFSKNNKIINIKEQFSQEDTIIISKRNNEEEIKNFQIFSMTRFCEYLLKKSPLYQIPKTLSSMAGEYIINSISAIELSNNKKLEKLSKSDIFAKNLYKVFGNFLELNILPTNLKNISKKIGNKLNQEDLERFNIMVSIFEKYCETLKENNLIDSRFISIYTLELLNKYPNYLIQLKKRIKTILVNSNEELTTAENELLELFDNVESIDFAIKEDPVLLALLSKYINNTSYNETPKNSNVKFLTFNDSKDEAGYIAQEILNETNKGEKNFSDYVVAMGNSNTTITFEDIFSYAKLPFNGRKTDNTYKHIVAKLIQYCDICKGLYQLETKGLNKAQQEATHAEINLNFEYRLTEILQDKFAKDKLINLLNNSPEISLIEYAQKHTSIMNKEDANSIRNEIRLINYLYTLYKENNIKQFITTVIKNDNEPQTDEFKTLLAQLFKQINLLEAILPQNKNNGISFDEFKKLLENPFTITETINDDYVSLTNLYSAAKYSGKTVYITGLDETSIPSKSNTIKYISQEANNIICAELPSSFKGITQTNEEIIKNAAKLLCEILSSSDKVIISTHKYQDKKEISPSIFLQYLQSMFPEQVQNIDETFNRKEEIHTIQSIKSKEDKQTAISDDEILYLSPSSIGKFQTCPRQFFLGNLLSISESGNFAASYGTIVHAIMENFNKNYLDRYCSKTLYELTDILFNSLEDAQTAIDKGFQELETKLICATDLLGLTEMKTDFYNAIQEMEKNQFFEKVPTSVISEKEFVFSLPEIPNVVFNGRIDAIYEFNGKYKIIDFKTGSPIKELSSFVCEKGVKLTSTSAIKNFPYQIPIYYFATQYAEQFEELRGKIDELGLLYLHPKNKKGGYHKNFIPADSLELYKTQIIYNLKATIVDVIREYITFPPTGGMIECDYCAYQEICDKVEEEEE